MKLRKAGNAERGPFIAAWGTNHYPTSRFVHLYIGPLTVSLQLGSRGWLHRWTRIELNLNLSRGNARLIGYLDGAPRTFS